MIVTNPPAAVRMSSGSYTGNNGANRAITHELGVTPKLVLIFKAGATEAIRFIELGNPGYIAITASTGWDTSGVVTVPNATNFYVGDGVKHDTSANANAVVYHWIAFTSW